MTQNDSNDGDLGLLPAERMLCAVLPVSPISLYGLILESADECRGAVA